MPERRVTSVQLLLYEVGDVFLGVEPVHRCFRELHNFDLQNIVHVCILDLDLGCRWPETNSTNLNCPTLQLSNFSLGGHCALFAASPYPDKLTEARGN